MNFQKYISECIDALIMECSPADMKNNPDAKKLVKYINKQERMINKIARLQQKVLGY